MDEFLNLAGKSVKYQWESDEFLQPLNIFWKLRGQLDVRKGILCSSSHFFFSAIESEMHFCGTVYDKLIWIYVREEGSEDIRMQCLWQLEGAEGLCGLFSLDLCFLYRTSHQTLSSSGRLVYRSTKHGFSKGLNFNTRGTCMSQEKVICIDKTLGNTSKWQLLVPWEFCCTKKSVN